MHWIVRFLLASMLIAGAACRPHAAERPLEPEPAPEFTQIDRWFNSPPLDMAGLKGKVVLVEFWAYSCINCVRVMPHVVGWHERYRDQGLVVVGVHTPEYDEEHEPKNVQAAIGRFGITYPVAQDNHYGTWNAYSNRFWPALYLIDRQGNIVYRRYGEGDYETTEQRIRQLLAS